MARMDGREAAQDAMMEVARLAVAAAYRTPQMTGRLELKSEIVTGKDIAPIVEVFEAVHPISPVMYFDYRTLESGRPGPTMPPASPSPTPSPSSAGRQR